MEDKLLENIDLLLLDVDGVLTRGDISYTDDQSESKVFNVKDGLGIRLLMQAGIPVAIVTGRSSKALYRRCDDLGITLIRDGVARKESILDDVVQETGISPDRMGFMGDDLPDIGLMKKIGVGIAVADAHPLVKQYARLTTRCRGGEGAVREICEGILTAKNLLAGLVAMWT